MVTTETIQGRLAQRQVPSDNFSKWQLPISAMEPSAAAKNWLGVRSQNRLGVRALRLGQTWEVAAWESTEHPKTYSAYTTVNEYGFTPFANGGCQSLLQSTRMGSHPLLMVDVKVYYSQREYIATFVESICIHKFNECIPENFLII